MITGVNLVEDQKVPFLQILWAFWGYSLFLNFATKCRLNRCAGGLAVIWETSAKGARQPREHPFVTAVM
jgi:hypothetical protein